MEGGAYCYHANTVEPFTTSFGRMNHQGQTVTMEVKRLWSLDFLPANSVTLPYLRVGFPRVLEYYSSSKLLE